MAIVGYVDSISRSGVAGWAANVENQGTPVEIAVMINGEVRLTGLADQPRPGLATTSNGVATDQCGFRIAFPRPLSAFQQWQIEVVDMATREPIADGAHTLPAPRCDTSADPTPIVLTSTGRSGTTALMAEFARNPGIVVADRYPYEIKQIAYQASVFRTLVASADRVRSAHPDTMLLTNRLAFAGSNPYNDPGFFDLARPRARMRDYYESHVPGHYAQLSRDLIVEFYAILGASQDKASARFIAEKGDLSDDARQAARLFFPRVRELLMVRDPRDLLASAVSFWKLDPDEALQMLRTTLPQLLAIHDRHEPDVHTLRYEDLLRAPVDTRQALSGFLGLELPADLPALESSAMARHRTSGSDDPQSSVGRWQRDLTARQIAACDEAFRDYMERFDYAPSGIAADIAATPEPGADGPPDAPRREPDPTAWQSGDATVTVRAAGPDAARTQASSFVPGTLDGRPLTTVAALSFARGADGTAHLGPGWSRPEPEFVWSNAQQCHLALPPLRKPGAYHVVLAGAPFVFGEKLPSQTITVLVNGAEIGTVLLRQPSLIEFALPSTTMAGKIALTLRLPDAARPRDVGRNNDDRLLAFSLRWAAVLLAEPAATDQPGEPAAA